MSISIGLALENVQETLRKIDEEIAFHETRLLALKTHRNTLVPILKLPFEIVSRIILQQVQQTATKTSTQPWRHATHPGFMNYRPRRDWVHLMLVCKAFRTVALATAELWVFINLAMMNTNWTTTSLERAKNAPLVLDYRFNHRSGAEKLQLAIMVEKWSQAYAVSLTIQDENQEQIREWLQRPACLLGTLKIVGDRNKRDVLTMLPTFSDQLVELSIVRVDVGENPLLSWSVMKRLSLSGVNTTVDALYSLLCGMPALEQLAISQIRQGHVAGQTADTPVKKDHRKPHVMCHLRDIHIHTVYLDICRELLQILAPSKDTCQRLDIDVINLYPLSADDLSETTVLVFEYVLEHWGHLFPPGSLPPTTLVWHILGTTTHQYCFTLHSALQVQDTCEPAGSIAVNYILASANRYHTRSVAFAAVEVQGINADTEWLPQLTALWDEHAMQATKLIVRECWHLHGLVEWLVARRDSEASLTVKTVEVITPGYDEELVTLEVAKLRDSGVVDNVIYTTGHS
jgi:hypothetical protein